MTRTGISLPGTFLFSCRIPLRITDMNYGGHAGNDSLLSIIHEARMQWLGHLGFTEMEFGGAGMIMAEVMIEFKKELFYGDVVIASVAPSSVSRIGFDILYKLEKESAGDRVTVAIARTRMICYDYDRKKIVSVPEKARKALDSAIK